MSELLGEVSSARGWDCQRLQAGSGILVYLAEA